MLLREQFHSDVALFLDLLDPEMEERFSRDPNQLTRLVEALPESSQWVVIDEIQKLPKLLDVVHALITKTSHHFAMTGSSARQLRRGSANMLAGRAFVLQLFPLTHRELGEHFNLEHALHWGTLPHLTHLTLDIDKQRYLNTYARVYLKEEVWNEQLVRNLDPFRKFLEVAAQTNGEIINYARIASDVLADRKTVQSYFQILEDTLLGFFLEPYHQSIRKRQRQSPKFYLFDGGIKRALSGEVSFPIGEGTYAYGKAFEHFVLCELIRLNSYQEKDYRFSYLRTAGNVEIDVIIERPGLPIALVEIKSATRIDERKIASLRQIRKSFDQAEAYCLSRDETVQKFDNVVALPWKKGIEALGL